MLELATSLTRCSIDLLFVNEFYLLFQIHALRQAVCCHGVFGDELDFRDLHHILS